MLLAYTQKNNSDLQKLFKNNRLLQVPFDRCNSRLKYRTELFNFAKASESLAELLADTSRPMSWAECCRQSALDFLALNKQDYYISYSGGIDSTAAVVSLLETWSEEDLKRVTILLSHHSIEENVSFFNKYITRFKIANSLENTSDRLLASDSIFITGELGDQLQGSDIMGFAAELYGNSCLKEDYLQHVPKILSAFLKSEEAGKEIFNRFNPIVEECPFPIRTTHDFFWWYNFTQKWQHVKYRFAESPHWDMRAQYDSHVRHFYDRVYFQRWSLENHDKKMKKTWESYKFSAKEYIYGFTKNPDDLNLKKVQSLKKNYILSSKRIGYTADYKPIKNIEELRTYVRQDL